MAETMALALKYEQYMTKMRRHFHENPELSFKEVHTTEFIRGELQKIGVELQELDIETGVVALIKGRGPGRVTAVRADIDALPIVEKTGAPYKSKNEGVMHACGHDGHTAVLLGVAQILMELRDRFSGTVKLIFQPAEEGLGGAKKMVAAGALQNPDADSIVALHAWPDLNAGEIGVWPGKYMASADRFTVKITGRGGHGARPGECINPITAAAQAVSGIQGIVSNEISTMDHVVISVCMIQGGTAFNIIPDDISFGGTVRCLDENTRKGIKGRIERIVKGACTMVGCSYELEYVYGVPAVVNHPDVSEKLLLAATEALGEGHIQQLPGPTMGSEDFAEYVLAIGRAAFMRLGTGAQGQEKISLHNDRYNFNDEALVYGAAVLAQYVLNENGQ